ANEDLKKLNAAEFELSRMERELELARANYRKYSENLEQARIDQELQVAKITSLNFMQPPSLSSTPVSPQPLPTLALGTCVSALMSVCIALLAERRSRLSNTAGVVSSPPLVVEPAPLPIPSRSRRPEMVPA